MSAIGRNAVISSQVTLSQTGKILFQLLSCTSHALSVKEAAVAGVATEGLIRTHAKQHHFRRGTIVQLKRALRWGKGHEGMIALTI